MPDPAPGSSLKALQDGISSTLIATISLARGMFLLLSGRPGTPLRILCLVAFDTLHRLRKGKRLSTVKLKMLAVLLDFGACQNAAFDRKEKCQNERLITLQLLEDAGIGLLTTEYVRRLGALEEGRPQPGGDPSRFQEVRLYREAVVRLSLGMIATCAFDNLFLDEAIESTGGDGDLNLLFRIVMQCQIIDDVLDYSQDLSAGLPGFLTACQSLPQALDLTRMATLGYADDRYLVEAAKIFPLRVALLHVFMVALLFVGLRRWKARAHPGRRSIKGDI